MSTTINTGSVIHINGFGEFDGKTAAVRFLGTTKDCIRLGYRDKRSEKDTETLFRLSDGRPVKLPADAVKGYEIPSDVLAALGGGTATEPTPAAPANAANPKEGKMKASKNGAAAPTASAVAEPKSKKGAKPAPTAPSATAPTASAASPKSGKSAKPAKPSKTARASGASYSTPVEGEHPVLTLIKKGYGANKPPVAADGRCIVNPTIGLFLAVRDGHLTAAKSNKPGYNDLRTAWEAASFRGYMLVSLSKPAADHLVTNVLPGIASTSPKEARPARRIAETLATAFGLSVPKSLTETAAKPAAAKSDAAPSKPAAPKTGKSAPAASAATAPKPTRKPKTAPAAPAATVAAYAATPAPAARKKMSVRKSGK